ncbi:unnamed protein product [Lota lota]
MTPSYAGSWSSWSPDASATVPSCGQNVEVLDSFSASGWTRLYCEVAISRKAQKRRFSLLHMSRSILAHFSTQPPSPRGSPSSSALSKARL